MSITLPRLLSSGMVLQRNTRNVLWGTADETVTVVFRNKTYTTEPDENGAWSLTLYDLSPGGPDTMRIGKQLLTDVYVGEVWLCGGQSNMQLPMQRVKYMYPEEMDAENPYIRQFTVPERYHFGGPLTELDDGCWRGVSPQTIRDFSAVGYFFAKQLYAKYQVPVGLILTAIGGTPLHAWMGMDTLSPELCAQAALFSDSSSVARVLRESAEKQDAFFTEVNRSDTGLAEGFHQPGYIDNAWEERSLLAPWNGTGSVWLRKSLEIPPCLVGRSAKLFLGTVKDWDMAFVNGEVVGNTPYRYPPREYDIPALPAGRCVIAIRVIFKDGGGFTPGKQYLLATEAGSLDLSSLWRYHRGGMAQPPQPEVNLIYQPTGLYNGMITPLSRFAIKGTIWYQGESNAEHPQRYADQFEALVRQWRTLWGYSFPFLFTELAYWGEGLDWDAMRKEQRKCLRIPGTAMAAAADVGEYNDLHPQGKRPVGERLARCAMRLAYGETLPPSPFEVTGVWGGFGL